MTDPQDTPMKALDEAIAIARGVTNLARRIGVEQPTVSNWKARRSVPAEHCPAIERETGVRCERLFPNAAWDVLRVQCECGEPTTEDDNMINDTKRADVVPAPARKQVA